jgi:hypothetical protein
MLAYWNKSPRVEMSLHSDTLFWFRGNQSLLFLLNAACLAEKQQIPIVFGLTREKLLPMIYRTRGEHANHYATDVVYNLKKNLDIRFSVNKDQRWINVLYFTFVDRYQIIH